MAEIKKAKINETVEEQGAMYVVIVRSIVTFMCWKIRKQRTIVLQQRRCS